MGVKSGKVATTLVGMSKLSELQLNLKALESGPDPVLLEEVKRILTPVLGRCWNSGLWNAEA